MFHQRRNVDSEDVLSSDDTRIHTEKSLILFFIRRNLKVGCAKRVWNRPPRMPDEWGKKRNPTRPTLLQMKQRPSVYMITQNPRTHFRSNK